MKKTVILGFVDDSAIHYVSLNLSFIPIATLPLPGMIRKISRAP